MTISDAFPVDAAAAMPAAAPVRLEREARPHVRTRAQEPSVHRVTAAARVMWADLQAAWWLPESIPTVEEAWADRFPDRDRVPGNSDLLWRGWVVWNHTIGVAAPLLAAAVGGLLAPAVFVLRHPARFGLLLAITAVFAAAIVAAA